MTISLPTDFAYGPFFRTVGPDGMNETLGAGFMRKGNRREDHVSYNPACYSLCYLVCGRGEYHDSSGRRHMLEAGSYFQRIPGFIHSTFVDIRCEWVECFIDFGPGLCMSLRRLGMIDPETPCGRAGTSRDWTEAFAGICRELQSAPQEDLPALVPKMVDLHQRMLRCGRPTAQPADQALLTHACRLLERNLDQPLDLRRLCDEQGWGYERFRKLFRAAIGISPGRYRYRRRLDEARRLLLVERDLPITDIANRLGYSSVYEFSTQFKKHSGLPPGRFRSRRG